MRTNRSFAMVASWGSIPLLLLAVLLQACSSSRNPLDPVDPPDVQQPPAFGFAGVYARTSYSALSVEFHGTLSERYVIENDGSFRLLFESGRYGSSEYPGALYLVSSGAEETQLGFVFAGHHGQWFATATLRSKCLVVEYSDEMWSDFNHGQYCRP